MKTPDRQLLDDVFSDVGRDATLRRGARVLRRRRTLRRAAIILPPLLAAAAALVVVVRPVPPETPSVKAGPRRLTDDQLLAMFPGVPRAIVTVNGRKQLVFPRPDDAARYIGRAASLDVR